jgi:Raf kinase inhibitor-like YbhB/YbcL family protein
MPMTLKSSTFAQGQPIPKRQSCEGDDLSPPLSWSGQPPGTKSFALVCEDPDAPMGTWHHWGIYNIPAGHTGLAEGVSPDAEAGGIRQAVTDFGRPGYGGPCPPRGHGTHHYYFRLMALDVPHLNLPLDADCEQVKTAAKRHMLEEAVLMGTFAR